MRDGFGREIDYMRISVIDSCNLNCYYCNPCDNNEHCHALNILSVKEVLCIVRAATRLGIKHFRLTGGEPLLHPQLDEMVLQIKKDAEELAAKLEGVSLKIATKVSATGTIFGSVGNIQIADELAKLGHNIDRKIIVVKDAVKEVGNYKAIVKLHKEVSVEIPFEVVAEEA